MVSYLLSQQFQKLLICSVPNPQIDPVKHQAAQNSSMVSSPLPLLSNFRKSDGISPKKPILKIFGNHQPTFQEKSLLFLGECCLSFATKCMVCRHGGWGVKLPSNRPSNLLRSHSFSTSAGCGSSTRCDCDQPRHASSPQVQYSTCPCQLINWIHVGAFYHVVMCQLMLYVKYIHRISSLLPGGVSILAILPMRPRHLNTKPSLDTFPKREMGIAMKSTLIKQSTPAKALPELVDGVTSPYPTVVTVTVQT